MQPYKIIEHCLDGVGLSDKKGIAEKDVDQEQLRMGIEVEKEHTNDIEIAKKIALDHLSEEGMEKYYTNLINMEKRLKKE